MAWKSSAIYCLFKKNDKKPYAVKFVASIDCDKKSIGYIYHNGMYNAVDIDTGLRVSKRYLDMSDCRKEVENKYTKIEAVRLEEDYKNKVEALKEIIKEGVT